MSLIKKMLARKSRPETPLMPDGRVVFVGDLHGRQDLLEDLLAKLEQSIEVPDHLVFLGDYIDRGENSASVLRLLHHVKVTQKSEHVECLMGNHEEMMLKFLESPVRHGSRWIRYGGLQTLASYKLRSPSASASDAEWTDLRDALREQLGPSVEEWMKSLPMTWRSGNIVAVHAAADPAMPIDVQNPDVLLWGHDEFGNTPREDGVWVVHGHTIVDTASAKNGVISVDTGAYATGKLTAAIVEPGKDIQFLST